MSRKILMISALLLTTACSKEPADSSTARLDAVEVESGTISDAMITLDQAASDGTAIDNSVPADPGKKEETPPADSEDAAVTAESAATDDTVVVPPISSTAAPTPVTK